MIPDTLLSIIGMYDSLKPVVMKGSLEGSFLASFLLGWYVDLPSLLLSSRIREADFSDPELLGESPPVLVSLHTLSTPSVVV